MRVTDGKVRFRTAWEGGPGIYLDLVKVQKTLDRLLPLYSEFSVWFIPLVSSVQVFAIQALHGLRSGHHPANRLPQSGELADGRYYPVPDLVPAAVPISHKPGLLKCT